MIFKAFAGNIYVGILFANTYTLVKVNGEHVYSGYLLKYKKLNLKRIK